MGVYHFASRTKTRDKIATMFNILIIYSSKKDTLESVETKNIYRCTIKVTILQNVLFVLGRYGDLVQEQGTQNYNMRRKNI